MKELLYEAVEAAVANKTSVAFPADAHPTLEVNNSPTGPAFVVPGLYWMDDCRNVYEVWLQIEQRGVLSELYVSGTRTLDGMSSGDASMIRPECRYQTMI